jgi:HlyD family secretion protein
MAEAAAPAGAAQPEPPQQPKETKAEKAARLKAEKAARAEQKAAEKAAKAEKKKAEPRTSDPEQEKLMQVTSPQGWIALVVLGATLAAVIVWSLIGSIPERIEGQGIVVRGGGLRQVRASGGGTLTKFTLKISDTIKDGQLVGEITQVGSSEDIKTARQNLDQAQRESDISRAENEATIAGIRSKIAGADSDKRNTQLLLQKAKEDVARLSESLSRGLVTRNRVETAERDAANFEAQLNAKDAEIASHNAQIRSLQQKIRAGEDKVAQARRAFERVGSVSSARADIVSTVAGRVIEVKKRVGDQVQEGEVVATVEPPGAGVEPVVYINSGNGKRIKPGMEALVLPATVRKDEYGFLKAKIGVVGEYPVTAEAVKALTGNDQLTQELLAQSTKIEVHAVLEPNPSVPSGYSWTTSSGPPFQIDGGTRVMVAVIVDRKPPISYVLPIFSGSGG